ncbi:MAG: shikimate dehydrogenase, partial [Dehalococcoidia bacterium]
GGAARAVVYALAEASLASLVIVNRTLERAQKLAEQVKRRYEGVAIEARGELKAGLPYDLLVNCTSIGMRHGPMEGRLPLAKNLIQRHALVYDLVYNPPETPLLREARERGARALGGLPMLIYQGAIAFELWMGREAPLKVMFEVARKALS